MPSAILVTTLGSSLPLSSNTPITVQVVPLSTDFITTVPFLLWP
ncbi:hypothetical protein [Brachyspira pilosicoli]|nr:hypothetical protein [Brachyspira pilosicoli]